MKPESSQNPMKNVWILDEGSQGHLVQSRGMIRELSKLVPLNVTEVPVSCALPRRISRSLVKRLLRKIRRLWMFRLLHPRMKLPDTRPDLLVSSGPHSLAALEFLSKHHDCPSVFVQGTIRVPEGAVTVIMRPFDGERRADYLFIPLLFTEITPQALEQAKKEFLEHNTLGQQNALNALFIGNSSAKIQFTREDWERIARFVNEQSRQDGSRWLITTSYRTGREIELLLKRAIDPDAIAHAVWYSEAPRKVTKAFLGLADRIFVTMDSLTMVTEAVASGKPACALCPAGLSEDKTNTHLRYIHHLAQNGMISLVRPGIDQPAPPEEASVPALDYSASIDQLMTRLQWKP